VNSGEEVWRRLGVARRKKRKSSRRKGVRVGFYRRARPCRREGEREAVTGQAQDGGRRRRALGCVAAARLRRPDVAARGTASRGSTGDERSGGATRGRGRGGADLQRLGNRPAAAGHARAVEAKELGESRKTMEDLGAKSKKARDPTVKHK
jgi:hypothetical protein